MSGWIASGSGICQIGSTRLEARLGEMPDWKNIEKTSKATLPGWPSTTQHLTQQDKRRDQQTRVCEIQKPLHTIRQANLSGPKIGLGYKSKAKIGLGYNQSGITTHTYEKEILDILDPRVFL